MTEQSSSTKSRRVFLCMQQWEDVWCTPQSVSFVVDTGLQKKMVNDQFAEQKHVELISFF